MPEQPWNETMEKINPSHPDLFEKFIKIYLHVIKFLSIEIEQVIEKQQW